MKMSDRGLAELAGHEGIVTSRYRDSVGVWTIGVGHTAAAGHPDPKTTIGERPVEELIELFRRDVERYENRVNRAVKVLLSQTQFDALVSFDYNTGGIFKAQLTKSLNRGDYAGAARGFMGWVKPPEIKARRQKEQRLFRDGVYSNRGMATIWPANHAGRVQWSKAKRVNVLELLHNPQTPTRTIDPSPEPDTDPAPVNAGTNKAAAGIGIFGAIAAALYAAWEWIF